MLALARVLVLVQGGAVEARERVGVLRKVGRHPVEDDADPAVMTVVDQIAEIVGTAKAAGRREVARRLVAPRQVERMLGHRQQLDMGESHVLHVIDEPSRELPIVQELALRSPLPRTQMHLVHRHRGMLPIPGRAPFHPLGVLPGVLRLADHDRGRARPRLELLAVGIGFEQHLAGVPISDLEAVERSGTKVGDEELPDAAARTHPHGMTATVPAVEIADHADALGIRRPHGEEHAAHAVHVAVVGAEDPVGMPELAFGEEMEIDVRDLRRIAVGIVGDVLMVGIVAPDQPVAGRDCRGGPAPLEEIRLRNAFHV